MKKVFDDNKHRMGKDWVQKHLYFENEAIPSESGKTKSD